MSGPYIRPSVRPTVRPSVRPTARPSVRPPVYPSVYPSVRPSTRSSFSTVRPPLFVSSFVLSDKRFICLLRLLLVGPSVCLPVRLSVSLVRSCVWLESVHPPPPPLVRLSVSHPASITPPNHKPAHPPTYPRCIHYEIISGSSAIL